MDDVMPEQNLDNFSIIEYDDDFESSTVVTFVDDSAPNTVLAFFPDGQHQEVTISTHECELYDRGKDPDNPSTSDEWVKSFTTHEQGLTALFDARLEHGLVHSENYGYVVDRAELTHPRFYIDSLDHSQCPEWFLDVHITFGYKSTDAWRGHSTFKASRGWSTLVRGWVTSWPDDTTRRKVDAIDVYEALCAGDIIPPVPMIWCFGATSNVFSISTEIIIPDGSESLVNVWLDGLDITTAERFDNAFT